MLAEQLPASTGECQGSFFLPGEEVAPHLGHLGTPCLQPGDLHRLIVQPLCSPAPTSSTPSHQHFTPTFGGALLHPLAGAPQALQTVLSDCAFASPCERQHLKGLAQSRRGPTTSEGRAPASSQTGPAVLQPSAQHFSFRGREPSAELLTVLL